MRHRAYREQAAEAEHVLLIAPRAAAGEPLTSAFLARGAEVSLVSDVTDAIGLACARRFTVILVLGRGDAVATSALLELLSSEALGQPPLLLVVSDMEAHALGGAAFRADEVLLSSLSPGRIVTASGVGLRAAEPLRFAA